ncbi:hypothetical protein BOX15_Mlig013076g1 [Macrostomum lignano]|uniref:Doublecortin domain-containing protein n=1 Tax=Macrostomum lignano TaxID=282301 RepID=A0A267GHQ9_9PLAT|nr:hypothetical protein BOX15_Mlig013076g1 [Macrostomum lignano]
MRFSLPNLALSALAVGLAMAVLMPAPAAAFSFRLFRRSANFSTNATVAVKNATNVTYGGYARTVQFLVRKVDDSTPYYRSMAFQVPEELNYMMGDNLYRDFASALGRHCNATNITRIVRNNLQLLQTDDDVWRIQDGDRIEIWTNSSGPATRAETASAFAKAPRRKGCPPMGPPGRPGRPGRPGDRMEEMPIGEEPIVVPDWDEMDD